MAKISVSFSDFMADPNLSITSSPFAPGAVIIKRASFKKGEIPPHLSGFLIKPGECRGLRGTVIYKGKLVPKTAKCVAEKHRRGR